MAFCHLFQHPYTIILQFRFCYCHVDSWVCFVADSSRRITCCVGSLSFETAHQIEPVFERSVTQCRISLHYSLVIGLIKILSFNFTRLSELRYSLCSFLFVTPKASPVDGGNRRCWRHSATAVDCRRRVRKTFLDLRFCLWTERWFSSWPSQTFRHCASHSQYDSW